MQPIAETAGWVFGWLLRNSAHAAVLAVVVIVLEATVCRRLSPRWRYGLWLLVVARLLIPLGPGSSVSLFNLVDFAPRSVASVALQVLGLPSPVPVPLPEPQHPLTDTPPWFLGALALWLPGAIVLGCLVWRDHRRLQNALITSPTLTGTGVAALDLLDQSRAVMDLRRRVALVETPHVPSPAITGTWQPRLLLPAGLLERLTPDETRFLFLHELAHVKRADLVLNWILAAVQVLHWFNPLVWIALRRLLNVREEVCDDLVLRRCFPGASREYGLTLLRILEECAPRRLVPSLAGIFDDVHALRRRIRCIVAFGRPEPRPWIPACLTLFLAVSGLTEHQAGHALVADAPTTAEIHAQVRRVRSGATRQRPLRRPDDTDLPARTEGSPAMIGEFARALRRVFAEAQPGAADASQPGVLPQSGSASARLALRPGATQASVRRTIVDPLRAARRPYPLPPVSQRGDILRPRRPAGDPAGEMPSGRAVEVVPYFGRQAVISQHAAGRQNG